MKRFLWIAALCLSMYNAMAQEEWFYYYEGKKIQLTQSDEKILLKLKKGIDKKKFKEYLKSDPDYMIDNEEQELDDYVVLSRKRGTGSKKEAVLAKHLQKQEVHYASIMFTYNGKHHGIVDEFIVKLKDATTLEQLQELVKKNHCELGEENEFVRNQFMVMVPKSHNLNTLQMTNLFYESDLFEFAEPNFFHQNTSLSNDPDYGKQWPLKNTANTAVDIDIEEAWKITEGNPNIKIAVLDEGVDLNHKDLKDNLLKGYDALKLGSAGDGQAAYHGTHCAGIIGAVKDNGIGIAGVAPKCKMIPIRVKSGTALSGPCADGINWAVDFAYADVLSCSWYLDLPSAVVTEAINNATTKGRGGLGCVVVFASGNNGNQKDDNYYDQTVRFPAYLENVIAVGGTTKDNFKAHYSAYSDALDVVAPGGDNCIGCGIQVTDNSIDGECSGDYCSDFWGTSAACPHVAGLAGLILSVNKCLNWQQVKQIIELGCDKVGGMCYSNASGHPNGTWNNHMGHGKINAYRSLKYAYSTYLNTYTNVNGSDNGISARHNLTVIANGCTNLVPGTYNVIRHEVATQITYSNAQSPFIIGSANGLSMANPNYGDYYMEVVNVTSTSAKLKTFVYEVFDAANRSIGWIPASPANVRFYYTVMSSMEESTLLQNDQVNNSRGYNVMTDAVLGNYAVIVGGNITCHAGKSVLMQEGFAVDGGMYYAFTDPFFTCTQYPQGKILRTQNQQMDKAVVAPHLSYQTSYEHDSIINKVKEKEGIISLYPVPFENKLTIEYQLNEAGNVSISLWSMNGEEMIRFNNVSIHEPGKYKLELHDLNLATGAYVVRLETASNEYSKTIIKK